MNSRAIDDFTRQPPTRSYIPDPSLSRRYLCPRCNRADAVHMAANLVELYQRRRAAVLILCDLCQSAAFTPDDAAAQRRAFFCKRCNFVVCPKCQRTRLEYTK